MMFEKQKNMQAVALGKTTPVDDPEQFYLHTTACIVELSEAIQCDSRWKHLIGGKRKTVVDADHKLEELVDAFHFLINAALYSGFDANDIVYAFLEKNITNINRQEGGE